MKINEYSNQVKFQYFELIKKQKHLNAVFGSCLPIAFGGQGWTASIIGAIGLIITYRMLADSEKQTEMLEAKIVFSNDDNEDFSQFGT